MKTEDRTRRTSAHEIKILPSSALAQAEDIWSLSFHPAWQRDFFSRELDTIYGAFKKDRLDAVAGIINVEMRIGEKWAACGGIALVATAPGARNLRLTDRLVAQCVSELKRKQVPVAALFPFSCPFYERMGFATTHFLDEIEVSTAFLRKAAASGDASRFQMLPLERSEETLPAHKRMCEKFNLSISRSAKHCRAVAFHPLHRHQYFIHENGYMLWGLDQCAERKLYVLEFVYNDEQTYFDGLALLGSMNAQYESVIWYDHDHEALLRLGVPDPKPIVKRIPFTMSRVVDLAAFEKLIGRSLGDVRVYDPLGVSAPTDGSISVGELLQHVAGVWRTPDPRFPKDLYRILGDRPIYSMERF